MTPKDVWRSVEELSAPEGMQELVEAMLATGEEYMDAIGSDIADPDSQEASYPRTPLRPLLSLMEAAEEFGGRLGRIACPVLVASSPQDHVVDPANSELLAAAVSGPVERLTLARSYHVATSTTTRTSSSGRSSPSRNT